MLTELFILAVLLLLAEGFIRAVAAVVDSDTTRPVSPYSFVVVALIFLTFGLHWVTEGHVAVYWRGGALLNRVGNPGFNIKVPVIETYAQVQITQQTDSVTRVSCGTKNGQTIWFERIEVVNQLDRAHVIDMVRNFTVNYDQPNIFAKVYHEVSQLCNKYTAEEIYIQEYERFDEAIMAALQSEIDRNTLGLTIKSVRVPKPTMPPEIMRNYEEKELERTKLAVVQQRKKRQLEEAEAKRQVEEAEAKKLAAVAVINAQREANVSLVQRESELKKEQKLREVQAVIDQKHADTQRSEADAKFYVQKKEAEGNALKHTPAYIELQRIGAMRGNNYVYFGPSIPAYMGALGIPLPPRNATTA